MSLAALVQHLCLRAGLSESRIDVSGLWGAVEGYAITALESPRASITTLSRHFGFDAVETEGVIRFVMRGRASAATLAPDDLVAAREGDVLELTRGQETEVPQALKWQVARADKDYDGALVEARRITVDTTRIASESFPMAVPPEEAERRCRGVPGQGLKAPAPNEFPDVKSHDRADTFWEHRKLAGKLHGIERFIVIDHRDCEACRSFVGPTCADNPDAEMSTHMRAMEELADEVRAREPGLEVKLLLMDLDGRVVTLG